MALSYFQIIRPYKRFEWVLFPFFIFFFIWWLGKELSQRVIFQLCYHVAVFSTQLQLL